jgi:hypothetical protein
MYKPIGRGFFAVVVGEDCFDESREDEESSPET